MDHSMSGAHMSGKRMDRDIFLQITTGKCSSWGWISGVQPLKLKQEHRHNLSDQYD